LARLVDWAEQHTSSAIWSCLASHAAAYRLDGLVRRPLGKKMFGVFECDKVADHPLVAGRPRWLVPHSRFNELPETVLTDAGYQVLSRSPQAGVDIFIKQRESLFVFLQGHPEYDATALFGEYRRDVRRFLAGERDYYPDLPHGYFNDRAVALLSAFRERAFKERGHLRLEEFPAEAVGAELSAPWRDAAARVYANWLSYLNEARARRVGWATPPLPAAAPRVLDPTYA
jgi:homoserine O-succinyltransferase